MARKQVVIVACALCLALLAAATSLLRPTGCWVTLNLGELGSETLRKGYEERRAATPAFLRSDNAPSLEDELSAMSWIRLVRGDSSSVFAFHFPASDTLQLTQVRADLPSLRVLQKWNVDDISVNPRGLGPGELAMDAASQGRSLVAYYLHPWSGEFVRLEAGPAIRTITPRRYESPWPEAYSSPLPLDSESTALAYDKSRNKAYALHAAFRGPTYLSIFDFAAQGWRTRKIAPPHLAWPVLCLSEGKQPRVFYYRGIATDESVRGIYEWKASGGALMSDAKRPAWIDDYAVCLGKSGGTHLVYVADLPKPGLCVLHRFVADQSVDQQEIAHLDTGGLDMGDQPVPAGLRLSAVLDARGSLHVAYFDFLADAIVYATNDTGKWHCEEVCNSRAAASTSILVDPKRVLIAYADVTARAAYLAGRPRP